MPTRLQRFYEADTLPSKRWLVRLMWGFLCMTVFPGLMLLSIVPCGWALIVLVPEKITYELLMWVSIVALMMVSGVHVVGGLILPTDMLCSDKKSRGFLSDVEGFRSLVTGILFQALTVTICLSWMLYALLQDTRLEMSWAAVALFTFCVVPIFTTAVLMSYLNHLKSILHLKDALTAARRSCIAFLVMQILVLLLFCLIAFAFDEGKGGIVIVVTGVFVLVAVISFSRLCFELLLFWRQHDDLSGQFEAQRAANQLH